MARAAFYSPQKTPVRSFLPLFAESVQQPKKKYVYSLLTGVLVGNAIWQDKKPYHPFFSIARTDGLHRKIWKGNSSFNIKRPEKDLYDLGGYTAILDRIADLVRYLQDPEGYTKSHLSLPKGVIISGPPGVGKTFIAEAVAGHAGVPIIMVSAPELESRWVGGSEARMRELFQLAQRIAPCVICIDEFDSIGVMRIGVENMSNEHRTRAQTINSNVNQLLSLLSQEHPGVVVIVTTNHRNELDPALGREGRFDRQIVLELPTMDERKSILEIHAKKKNAAFDTSFEELAAISTGFSGAKLEAWVNEALLSAVREKSDKVETRHFDAARTLLDRGVLNPGHTDPQKKTATASHEAGHALVGHLLGLKLFKVTTYNFGFTEWIDLENRNPTKQEVLNQICMHLAGRAAEVILERPMLGSEEDFAKAKALATKLVNEGMGSTLCGSSKDVETILQQEMQRAQELLKKHRKQWEGVRDTLIQNEELYFADFLKVLDGKVISKPEQSPLQSIIPLPPKSTNVIEILGSIID